ncbi:MAG TPA: lantibiotic dehydratase, partial [Hymenobacter sp.]
MFRQGLRELGVETQSSNFFQVDFTRSAHGELALSEATVQKTLQAIAALSRLSAAETMQERHLREFRSAFMEKYETAEVSLAEVIDGEVGIGFPVLSSFGNISKDLHAHAYIQGKPVEKHQEPWHAYLQGQYERVLKQGGQILDLKDEDIAKFPPKVNQLAPTFAAMLSLISCNERDQIYLQSVGGTTANNLLGRFGDLDRSLGDLCQIIADKEQTLLPDAVLAEIVHLPEGRVGNILQRPVLRKYEIPYLSGSSVGGEQSLPVADLTVAVEGSTIVLRSRKLGEKVVPRLSNAHNYAAHALPVYHFLCAVQHQGKGALGIDWGEWAEGVTFLPRVTYKGVILQAASWKFSHEDFVPVLTAADPLEALRTFFDYWKLPASVAITQADNQLVCHTGRKEYRELFLQEVRKTKSIQVVEWLHFAKDTDGQPYTHQVVVPLYQESLPFVGLARQAIPVALQRTFFPGSEWLYMKIYCGAHLSDRILLEGLLEPLETLRAGGVIDKFFFIRYADPHYHIRLRLHLSEATTGFGAALNCLYAALEPYTQKR